MVYNVIRKVLMCETVVNMGIQMRRQKVSTAVCIRMLVGGACLDRDIEKCRELQYLDAGCNKSHHMLRNDL